MKRKLLMLLPISILTLSSCAFLDNLITMNVGTNVGQPTTTTPSTTPSTTTKSSTTTTTTRTTTRTTTVEPTTTTTTTEPITTTATTTQPVGLAASGKVYVGFVYLDEKYFKQKELAVEYPYTHFVPQLWNGSQFIQPGEMAISIVVPTLTVDLITQDMSKAQKKRYLKGKK